mmetsp:Transcript_51033/g.114880  ORF Transcript_51033/g.114880 Transcript_51033/m.114880 type:complete len:511 (+) Transcript_51033:132-1664(+)
MEDNIGPIHGKTHREVIHIQVGKSGNAIGHEFWRDICEEHRIDFKSESERGTFSCDNDKYKEHLEVFFNEARNKQTSRWVPRALLVDLNMQDLAQISQSQLGDLYRPENVIGNDEGSGNCYAKAFHTEGPDLADKVLDTVRREVEKCHKLQGVQFCHGISGGTGAGLTGLIQRTLYDYLGQGSKCIMQNFCLAPAPGMSDVVIEPYNAALAMQDLLEQSHQVFLFDNSALSDICRRTLDKEVPKMSEINNIVALCMSCTTSCLRFSGPLNSDLRKMQTNLVPFRNAHFLISGFAPLTAPTGQKYRKMSVQDMAQQMISKDNVTVKCDPLNPGDKREGIETARFLAAWASWRGKDFRTREVEHVTHSLQKKGSRFDKHFPDWISGCIASNICDVPHTELGDCVCLTSNNTAVHEVFDRIMHAWDSLHKPKAYLHVFEQDGISVENMMESRNILEYISEQYCEFAKWEDNIIKEAEGEARPAVHDPAITNEEQGRIAHELAELAVPMYISSV